MTRELDSDYPLGALPVPRYVIPPYCGIAISFPREVVKEGLSTIHRLGYFASFAVALNEAADIGVSIDERFKSGGIKQEHFVPLLQTRNYLYRELDKRFNRFAELFPDQREVARVVKDDFLLLSRNRKLIDPVTFIELDSGIIEAGYAAVVFSEDSILARAGVNFPGDVCEGLEELLSKYAIYLLYSNKDHAPKNITVHKIQRLHALAMAMKVNDDMEGMSFDKLVRLPNFALWADEESIRTGVSSSEVLSTLKEYYLERSGGNIGRAVNRALAVGSHVSGRIKDMGSRNGIHPSDDVGQLHQLTRMFHVSESTVLRHQLDKTNLLRLALS